MRGRGEGEALDPAPPPGHPPRGGTPMRALVLEKFNGPFVAKDVPTPTLAPHEALVRVRNVGVCGTDVKIRADRMGLGVIPLIMGHEIAGEVAEVGRDVRGFAPGDRVIVNFYVTCGRCPALPRGTGHAVRGGPPARLQHGRRLRGVREDARREPLQGAGPRPARGRVHPGRRGRDLLPRDHQARAGAARHHAGADRRRRRGPARAPDGAAGRRLGDRGGRQRRAARAGPEPGRRRGGGRPQRALPRGGPHS